MKKKVLIPICAIVLSVFVAASIAQAQTEDVLYLKSGRVVRGTILEIVPSREIKILTNEGETRIYDINAVKEIKKQTVETEKAEYTIVQRSEPQRRPETVAPRRSSASNLPPIALSIAPLGFLQFGPVVQVDFRMTPDVALAAHARFLGLGALSPKLTDYKEFNKSSMALGAGAKYFFGGNGSLDKFYLGFAAEYGWGGGTSPYWVYSSGYYSSSHYVDGVYEFAYVVGMTSFGYRWRFTSGLFLGLGLSAGAGTTIEDRRVSPDPKDYEKKAAYLFMLDFTLGVEL
jgi:hypothetical protein